MAETTTVNFGWTKPDPGASANTWGQTLNATTDKIDAQAFANKNAGVPVGAIVMYAGTTAPANWMICNGAAISTTTYAALFAVLGTAFNIAGVPAGSFNLPNLVQKFPIGAGPNALGSSGGSLSVTLGATNLPAHAHTIADPQHYHNIGQGANQHSHGVNQWAHIHAIATGGHTHVVSMNDHSHGYSQWSSSGGVAVRADAPSYFQQNIAANTGGASNLSGGTSNPGNLGGNTDTLTSAISIQGNSTGITNSDYALTRITTTDNFGSGVAFSVVPPFQAINYIIRVQ